MIPLRKRAAAFVASACIVFAFACTGPMQAGSETTSGVEIAVSGTTVRVTTTPSATVIIFDAGFSPGDTQKTADTALSDDSGHVAFVDLPAGTYNVFAYPPTPKKGAAVLGIPILQNTPMRTDSASFASLRTITGTVTRQGQPGSQVLVYIAGSPFSVKTDDQGKFGFTAPPGKYTVVARPTDRWLSSGADTAAVDLSRPDNSTVTIVLELK